PDDIYKGWAFIEVKVSDCIKYKIPDYPESYKVKKRKMPWEEQRRIAGGGNLPGGRGGSKKKFNINIDGEIITIRVPKSLTNKAVCFWVKSWAPQGTKVITPANRELSLDGEKLTHEVHFVYFILNRDSNVIKISIAKNLDRRLKSLQTSSPAKLELLKSVSVSSSQEAHEQERALHQQFRDIQLTGEWFKAEPRLMQYVEQL
ncbi:MAG: GIY-YIG nuclease family protein, partial [Bacteroidota bacterium]